MCKYCESEENEHFLCDSCGDGMCDDCYDSDIEHIHHIYMPDICESEEEEEELENFCNGDFPDYLCHSCYAEFKKQTKVTTFTGSEIVTEENWFEIASGNEYPIEFAFDDSMTGTIEEDGIVYYNYKGMNLYEFQNTKDAYAYFFKTKKECKSFEFKESCYIGNRDEHPTLDGWCKRMGIKTLNEEDGSSVYTDWKVSTYGVAKEK